MKSILNEIIVITRVATSDEHPDEFSNDWNFHQNKSEELVNKNKFNFKTERDDADSFLSFHTDNNLTIINQLLIFNGIHLNEKSLSESASFIIDRANSRNFFKNKKSKKTILHHFSDKNDTFKNTIKKNYPGTILKEISSAGSEETKKLHRVYLKLAHAISDIYDGKIIEPTRIHESLKIITESESKDIDQALKTLHYCLTPDTADKIKEIADLKRNLNHIKIGGQSVVDFIENSFVNSSKNDPFDVSYMKSLVALRDRLLQ